MVKIAYQQKMTPSKFPHCIQHSQSHTTGEATYTVFIAEASVKGIVVLGKESFDLLQTLYLEHLRPLLNHFPTQCEPSQVRTMTSSIM